MLSRKRITSSLVILVFIIGFLISPFGYYHDIFEPPSVTIDKIIGERFFRAVKLSKICDKTEKLFTYLEDHGFIPIKVESHITFAITHWQRNSVRTFGRAVTKTNPDGKSCIVAFADDHESNLLTMR